MRILQNILLGVLVLVLLYGGFLLVERLTRQELARVSNSSTQEAACLMWQPRLLKGDGVCSLELLNSQGKVVDSVRLGTLKAGFDGLQQYGQLSFEGQNITVASLRTGELVQRFVVLNGRLSPAN